MQPVRARLRRRGALRDACIPATSGTLHIFSDYGEAAHEAASGAAGVARSKTNILWQCVLSFMKLRGRGGPSRMKMSTVATAFGSFLQRGLIAVAAAWSVTSTARFKKNAQELASA